ncbi:gliding motility protein GldM [Cytophaga hutchinsonii]|jgi:gliding motility-associated protein GldM|uniref:Gliding motility-related protein n=1 Tax=Cytophaga hutchinsonii (strain ATCC 33406 / DSM 1761 / CIP 103989 / NBRC 15051 / NCIMB 9469 / D465) TaxID=269798 RepID=A0A6N4SMH1_CYTH3|nr:gliding motility protein GldM [Cytophaga hutchinsonii]ABG57465.1 gliding motility-related protein [Cytophaga hutchinsonii ATCC 33406]SFW98119.1 gliding motility-associated protein GldM [Cytophaga hutchinsonii ATCC 33406]
MAGGKESPRQKMIGMMYLVLTALLALQVSSAIMEKFIFLDESLMYAVGAADKGNAETVAKIDKAVADGGGKDKAVSDKAIQVRTKTAEMIKTMNDLREEMIMKSGGREADGSYKGAKEEEAIAGLMVGTEGAKNGKAYALQTSLNKYGQEVIPGIVGKDMPAIKIAMDGKEDPKYDKKPDQKSKDFGKLNFAETPLVAALAVMATFESEVKKIETQALDLLASQVGAADLKFDQVFAVATAKSGVVAAGTDYEAELFLAASSSAVNPIMSRNGAPLAVENGRGKVKFKASATNYDAEGNSKQNWKGQIKINNKGKDTIFSIDVPYIVAKPVIQIQSASVNALYLRCGNELSVQVPALGATYNPSFTASGATLKPLGKGVVVVIPTSATGVKLNVASGGNAIGSQDFKVRGIPKPEILVLNGGKEVDQKNGVAAPGPRSLQVKAKADESFAQFLPKDARYNVTKWNVMLARGKRPVTQQNFTTEMANLSSFASQAQAGDRLIIEVQDVYRTNFLGEKEKVNIGTPIFTVPLQ